MGIKKVMQKIKNSVIYDENQYTWTGFPTKEMAEKFKGQASPASGCSLELGTIENGGNQMAEFKDVEVLKEQISVLKRTVKYDNSDYLMGYMSALSVVEGLIAIMDNVDVNPVVNGYWRDYTRWDSEKKEDVVIPNKKVCSVCADIWETHSNMRFCPGCGAKMDTQEENKNG